MTSPEQTAKKVALAILGKPIIRPRIAMDLSVMSFYQALIDLKADGRDVILRTGEWAVQIVAQINRDRFDAGVIPHMIRFEIVPVDRLPSLYWWQVEGPDAIFECGGAL